jgi:hypothetical protein
VLAPLCTHCALLPTVASVVQQRAGIRHFDPLGPLTGRAERLLHRTGSLRQKLPPRRPRFCPAPSSHNIAEPPPQPAYLTLVGLPGTARHVRLPAAPGPGYRASLAGTFDITRTHPNYPIAFLDNVCLAQVTLTVDVAVVARLASYLLTQ